MNETECRRHNAQNGGKSSHAYGALLWLRLIAILLPVLACLATRVAARAQDADGAEEAAAPAAQPAPPAAAPGAGAEPAPIDDPAVEAVLDSTPEAPAELVRAADILAGLDRPDLAKAMLQKLAAHKLDAPAMSQLVQTAGPAVVIKLAGDARLRPEAAILDVIIKTASDYTRSPARVAALIAQLGDASELRRQDAFAELVRARDAAVGAMATALADASKQPIHAVARTILVEIGPDALEPLLAMLDSNDERIKVTAIDVIGRIGRPHVIPRLLAPALLPASRPAVRDAARSAVKRLAGHVPDVDEAAALVHLAAQDELNEAVRYKVDAAAQVAVWQWDAQLRQPVPISYPAAQGHTIRASRLARDLYALKATDPSALKLHVEPLLAAAKFQHGIDRPLPKGAGSAYAEVAALGADRLEELLTRAIEDRQMVAATAIAEILGDVGNAQLLTRSGAEPSPLAKALQSPNSRLRFAALASVLKLAGGHEFPGSGSIPTALKYFVNTQGVPRAVIGVPNAEYGQQLAGFLTALGYEADRATNARAFFTLATSSPDLQLMVLHTALDNPPLDELLAQLRRDPRTALVPILLVRTPDQSERALRLAAAAKYAWSVPPAQDSNALGFQLGQLLAADGAPPVSDAERLVQAKAAIVWIDQLAGDPRFAFELRNTVHNLEHALFVQQIGPQAAVALGSLPSDRAQKALVDLASRASQPLAMRRLAAIAFGRSVERYGILLTSDEMVTQYDRYNSSAAADQGTQAVLGSILDTLEHKVATTAR